MIFYIFHIIFTKSAFKNILVMWIDFFFYFLVKENEIFFSPKKWLLEAVGLNENLRY